MNLCATGVPSDGAALFNKKRLANGAFQRMILNLFPYIEGSSKPIIPPYTEEQDRIIDENINILTASG